MDAEQKSGSQLVEHVRINYTDVILQGKHHDSDFLAVYWKLQNRFATREYGHKVCLHEAAHAILMEQDGIKNVRFEKPAILYNPVNGKFPVFGPIVHGGPTPGETDHASILAEGVRAAAGGIAVQEYLGVRPEESGANIDYRQFMSLCANTNPEVLKEKPDDLWKQAQDAAQNRLAGAETKEKVVARANEYMTLLYL